MWVIQEDIKVAPWTDLRKDIRRYLAADSETRRLKLTRETVTPQSSVQTDSQQDPLQEDLADTIGVQLRQNASLSRQILEERLWVIQKDIKVTP